MALLNDDMEWMVEPGEFVVSVGGEQPGFNQISRGVLSKSIIVTGEDYFVN
jgi:hypothetical protein